jgi:hypothetical protein
MRKHTKTRGFSVFLANWSGGEFFAPEKSETFAGISAFAESRKDCGRTGEMCVIFRKGQDDETPISPAWAAPTTGRAKDKSSKLQWKSQMPNFNRTCGAIFDDFFEP